MIHSYSCYQYKIRDIDVPMAAHAGQFEPMYKTGYEYVILLNDPDYDDIESSEWYESIDEAMLAAQDNIDRLENGEW